MFVALEGPKHSGKTAVAQRIAELQPSWLITKEPTDDFDFSNEDRLSGRKLGEQLLADRRRHIAEVIEPALDRGQVVVCVRYILSGLVFQSLDGIPMDEVWSAHIGLVVPTLNVVLLADTAALVERASIRGRTTRIESQSDKDVETMRYVDGTAALTEAGCRAEFLFNGSGIDLDRTARRVIELVNTEPGR